MWKKAIQFLPIIMENLPLEVAKEAVDAALDVIECHIQKSSKKWDDILILPLITMLRNIADIKDNDKGVV